MFKKYLGRISIASVLVSSLVIGSGAAAAAEKEPLKEPVKNSTILVQDPGGGGFKPYSNDPGGGGF